MRRAKQARAKGRGGGLCTRRAGPERGARWAARRHYVQKEVTYCGLSRYLPGTRGPPAGATSRTSPSAPGACLPTRAPPRVMGRILSAPVHDQGSAVPRCPDDARTVRAQPRTLLFPRRGAGRNSRRPRGPPRPTAGCGVRRPAAWEPAAESHVPRSHVLWSHVPRSHVTTSLGATSLEATSLEATSLGATSLGTTCSGIVVLPARPRLPGRLRGVPVLSRQSNVCGVLDTHTPRDPSQKVTDLPATVDNAEPGEVPALAAPCGRAYRAPALVLRPRLWLLARPSGPRPPGAMLTVRLAVAALRCPRYRRRPRAQLPPRAVPAAGPEALRLEEGVRRLEASRDPREGLRLPHGRDAPGRRRRGGLPRSSVSALPASGPGGARACGRGGPRGEGRAARSSALSRLKWPLA